MAGTSPTVRQRELGKRLRDLRNQHHLTVEDVAEKLLCSATKISRLETGARRPSLRDVRDMCALYDVDESTSSELMSLARGAGNKAGGLSTRISSWIPHRAGTGSHSHYLLLDVLHAGIVADRDYAKAIIRAIAPK